MNRKSVQVEMQKRIIFEQNIQKTNDESQKIVYTDSNKRKGDGTHVIGIFRGST